MVVLAVFPTALLLCLVWLPQHSAFSIAPQYSTIYKPTTTQLASSFYGKFEEEFDNDEDEEDEDDEEDDEDDYDLDSVDMEKFRDRMSSLFGDDDDSSDSSVDELISFATSSGSTTDEDTEWARPEQTIQKGLVLVANPERFCTDFGTTPSPSLLAKFGLTLPPPVDLGPDRRADLLPVLLIVETQPTIRAVLLNRRTGYLLGDLEQPEGASTPLLSKFCIQPLWFGGVDNMSSGLDMLHQCPAVKAATLLTEDGLYWGGDPAQAQDAMEEGDRVYTGFDFKFFVQSTLWSNLSSLEQEISDGTWFGAIVSKDIIFKSRDRMGTRRAKPLWTEIMELMGGKYKDTRDVLYESSELE